MNQHIIYRQKTTIKVESEEQAFAVQNAVSDAIREELSQHLQTVFDELAPNHEIIRIDSLKLDLGTIPIDNFRQVFAQQVEEEIRKAIVEKKENAASEEGITIIRKEQSLRDGLFYFLQTGLKPWFIISKNREEWESKMQQAFAKNDWQKVSLWLRENLRQQPIIIERLINQFSDNFLKKILNAIILFTGDEWNDLYNNVELILIQQKEYTARFVRDATWLNIFFSFLYHTNKEKAVNSLLKKAVVISQSNTMLLLQSWERIIVTNKLKTVWMKDAILQVINEMRTENKKKQIGNVDDTSNNSNTQPDRLQTANGQRSSLLQVNHPNNSAIAGNDRTLSVHKKRDKGTDEIISTSQYILNSGIVLLHPFLEMYFNEAFLLEEHRFKNEEACKRAVLLLHHLTTGDIVGDEYNLLLQKVMCGLFIEETLPNEIELSHKEREEAANLLQSVIGYWPPLKNTSIEGLRSTFLQREGKLEKKENGWLLTIEQKTVDVLLDKLPWGFSTIKLPWMKDMISVDWC